MSTLRLRPATAADVAHCERLLRSLPLWFGIEEAIVRYVEDARSLPTWVAELEGAIVGFVTMRKHNGATCEIIVMAVDPARHRAGIGRALVEQVRAAAKQDGCTYLMVKTLGPSRENEEYARTRRFYEALGFLPLEETTAFWGERNPCLILVTPVQA